MRGNSKQKLKKPPVLFDKTQGLISLISEIIGYDCIVYWTSYNGGICGPDVIGLRTILQKINKKEKIGLIIKSYGGAGTAALRMVNLLRNYCKKLVAFVPSNCDSAATMLALGADTIFMSETSYLTAIDSSLSHDLSPVDVFNQKASVSSDELFRVIRLWKDNMTESDSNPYCEIYKHVHPLVVGAVDRARSLSIRLCSEILSYHMKDEEKARELSERLNSDYPSHNYPITAKAAKDLGLQVEVMDEILQLKLDELNRWYSEMCQKAYTDFDENNYHNNEIRNILETKDLQIHYQVDEDWHYRSEERRWVSMNDESSWKKYERVDGKVNSSIFHID